MKKFIFLFFTAILFSNEIVLPSHVKFDDRLETVKKNREGKRIFIETGTAGGDGVFMALVAGFGEVYSTELMEDLHKTSKSRLKDQKNVHLYLGDSATSLKKILPLIQEPCLFWLDAHFAGEYQENCPILRELEAIASSPIKNHTILVDDVRCFGTHYYDYITIEQVKESIYRINPNYEITFEDGYIKNDVLVAKISMPK